MYKSKTLQGLLLASLVIPVGVALWVFLWMNGWMASLVAYGVAWGAIYLFEKGARRKPVKNDAPWLLGIILLGVVLAFVGGIIADGWLAYSEAFEGAQLFSTDFADFIGGALADMAVWSDYKVDALLAAVFAVLGAGSFVKDLFMPGEDKPKAKSKK